MASLLDRSLKNMSMYRHHNTSVNVLDAFTLNSQTSDDVIGSDDLMLSRPLGIHLPSYTSIESAPGQRLPYFNDSIVWIPLVLDDVSHLPLDLYIQ
jgi:hypothetical protein